MVSDLRDVVICTWAWCALALERVTLAGAKAPLAPRQLRGVGMGAGAGVSRSQALLEFAALAVVNGL